MIRGKEYYLVDLSHNKEANDRLLNCELAAKIRLYYGNTPSERVVTKFWNQETYPPCEDYLKKVKAKHIKWYIHNNTDTLADKEWNPDFIMGMFSWGKIQRFKKNFFTFRWYGNLDIFKCLKAMPYAGVFRREKVYSKNPYAWVNAPCLCFKYSKETINYLAGVLSTGLIVEYEGKILARYNRKIGITLEELGIPIEYRNSKWVFISPFWGAIMQKHMPEMVKHKWNMIPNAYRAEEYSAILWKIFTGEDPKTGGMPYLLSRRMIYYKYGSIKRLRQMWIENKLVELDSRFKNIIQEWQTSV